MTRRSPVTAGASRLLDWRVLLSLFFVLTLALAPSLAEARAGGKSSFGSRGSRTFENNSAAPITRSANPPMSPAPQATRPSVGGTPAAAAAGGSFFQRHPFLTGLTGGLLGAALFSHLGGMGHFLGGILQFLIIGLLIFLAIRLARNFFGTRGTPAPGATGGLGGRPNPGPMPRAVGAAAAPAPRFRGVDTTVNDSDLEAFQAVHASVQEAWSNSDLARLRQLMTPEMVGYFSEELTKNAGRGVRNIVSNVRLLAGDITESWEEGDLQYATAYMKWSASDYLARLDRSPGAPDYVAGGEPSRPIESEEVWTFVRRRGGNWLLSAIQQV
jgi:predicted lipid-binding transport protein (Tim44 family)